MAGKYQGWVWPVERHPIDGNVPVISDGFDREGRRGAGHFGVDIMYRRPSAGPVQYPQYSKWHYMPSNSVRVLACGPGTIHAVHLNDSHGISVEIDHHRLSGDGPRVSAYRHLSSCSVTKGMTVQAGTVIGIVGYDVSRKATETPNHLHFELWATDKTFTYSRERRKRFGFDPRGVMRGWTVLGRTGGGVPPREGGPEEPTNQSNDVPDTELLAEIEESNATAIGVASALAGLHYLG